MRGKFTFLFYFPLATSSSTSEQGRSSRLRNWRNSAIAVKASGGTTSFFAFGRRKSIQNSFAVDLASLFVEKRATFAVVRHSDAEMGVVGGDLPGKLVRQNSARDDPAGGRLQQFFEIRDPRAAGRIDHEAKRPQTVKSFGERRQIRRFGLQSMLRPKRPGRPIEAVLQNFFHRLERRFSQHPLRSEAPELHANRLRFFARAAEEDAAVELKMRDGELHGGRSRRSDIERFARRPAQSFADGRDKLRHDRPPIAGDGNATNSLALVGEWPRCCRSSIRCSHNPNAAAACRAMLGERSFGEIPPNPSS